MNIPLPPLVATALTLLAPGLAGQKSQDELKASFAAMQTHDWYTGGGWSDRPSWSDEHVDQRDSMRQMLPKYQGNARMQERIRTGIEQIEKKLAELDAAAAGFDK